MLPRPAVPRMIHVMYHDVGPPHRPLQPAMPDPLPAAFYARDALVVAEELVGAEIVVGEVRVAITEVEAYRARGDTANHARMGRTPRNAPMWGPPGHAYVYLCYGLHRMLNVVTDTDGVPSAVLVRGVRCIEGEATFRKRRPDGCADGPGRVGVALDLQLTSSGKPLFGGGPLVIHPRRTTPTVLAGPRVGIDYAAPEHRQAPWRLADAAFPPRIGRRDLLPR